LILPTTLEVHALLSDLTSQGAGERVSSPIALDPATAKRVAAFQHDCGLPMTGLVDALTWERILESSWILGSRLLFVANPFIQGEDVADLQVRLARLGFNTGRIDGIFGPNTERALKDFQNNTGLDPTGVLSRAVYDELLRLSFTSENRTPVTAVHDRGAISIAGDLFLGGYGPMASSLARALSLPLHSDPATTKNAAISSGAGLVVTFNPLPAIEGLHIHYWRGYLSHSLAGIELSHLLQKQLTDRVPGLTLEVAGMSLPILRETPMTALVVEHGDTPEQELREVVTVFQEVLRQVIHR